MKQIRFAVILAVIVIAIAECVPPSATDYAQVAPNHRNDEFGEIWATRWHNCAGVRVYEVWWLIGLHDAVYEVTNPPAELVKSAKQMSWLQSALCGNRAWIPIAGVLAGLGFLLLGMKLRPDAWETHNRQRQSAGKSRTPRHSRTSA